MRSVAEGPAVVRLAPSEPDVATLVARAREGDRWACEVLYRRHLADALRVATFVLGRTSDAEDVVHDAFVRAFERLGELSDPSAFGAWLARITANGARGRLRKRRFLQTFGLDRDGEDVTLERIVASDATPEQRAELAVIARALETLSADARTAWTLREVEGWALAEIAETLGVSLATAKRRIADAERVIDALVERSRKEGGGR